MQVSPSSRAWLGRSRSWYRTLASLLERFFAVDGTLAAAGLAFYLMLTIVPLLITAGGVFALLFGPAALTSALDALQDSALATDLSSAKDALLKEVASSASASLTLGSLGTVTAALWAGSKIVASLRRLVDAMNHSALRASTLKDRLLGAVVALLSVASVVLALGAAVVLPSFLPSYLTRALPLLVVVAFSFLLPYLVVVRLPLHAPPSSWHSLGVFAGFVGLLAVNAGFGLYVSLSSSLGAVFVVFGTAIALLVWSYLVFIVLLAAASIQAQLSHR